MLGGVRRMNGGKSGNPGRRVRDTGHSLFLEPDFIYIYEIIIYFI